MNDGYRVILAVDPGKATGVAVFSYDGRGEPELVESGEYLQTEFAQPIRKVLGSSVLQSIKVEVVCERFTINAQTVKNSQAPYSLEQIGILKQCMMDIGLDPETIIFQSPADAKAMFPNPKLKKLGYWHKGGEGHALDAIRHAVLRLAKSGWKPLKLLEE